MVSRTTVTKSRRSNPTLPFDLVEDILYRLPVKSLAQFKSVSKSWKSLISDSNFTKKNLRVSTTSHRLLFPKLTKGQYIFQCLHSLFPHHNKRDGHRHAASSQHSKVR
uniref:F-box domain-containing protein n=1 Tax=Medicago truncatula TaxID=3880 RepID=B7FMA3_MEDTR|nr:unknown [Medicago truncatula]